MIIVHHSTVEDQRVGRGCSTGYLKQVSVLAPLQLETIFRFGVAGTETVFYFGNFGWCGGAGN